MGIRSGASIVIKRRGTAASATAIVPAARTAADLLQEQLTTLANIPLITSFNFPGSKIMLQKLLIKKLTGRIFPVKIWRDPSRVVLKINEGNIGLTRLQADKDDRWTGEVGFDLYLKGKKKETMLRGILIYHPESIRHIYPKTIEYRLKTLQPVEAEQLQKERKKVSSVVTLAEKAGWKKLGTSLNSGSPIQLPTIKGSTVDKNHSFAVIAKCLGSDYFGTDGSEIMHDNSSRDRYGDYSTDSLRNNIRTHTVKIWRNRHAGEMGGTLVYHCTYNWAAKETKMELVSYQPN